MAGLFDFLMQSQGQQGGGLFGNVGNYLSNNQDALVALGLGMAGGATPMEGFKGGMQGFLQGRKSDQSRVAGEQFIKEMGLGVAPSSGPFSKPSPALNQPPGMPPQGGQPNFGNAIAGIESGGKYDALGPVTKTGDRAYGKYQVMGANIPQWTQAHLGQSMTPEQFLASPQAQDAVFKGQFGQYAQQYGPEGAARAWFAGPGGMNNLGAKDQLGTTVGGYGQKFAQAAGLGPSGAGPAPMLQQPQAPMQPPQPQGGGVQPVAQDQLGAIRNMPIGTILKWAMNPNLAGPQQEVAKELFKARLEDTKMTDGQKDYLRAKVDGYQGSFADWKNQPKLEDTGQRDQYGRPMPKAWVNSNDQSIRPIAAASAPGMSGAGSANPPIELVTDLRKQVQAIPSYKNLTEAAPIYRSMLATAGTDSKASDLNLVYGLGKIMDPGSVVREGEMVMVKKTASLPDWLVGSINALNGGAALTPDTRKAILAEAHNRVTAYKGEFDRDSAQYRGIVNDYGIKPSHVIPDFGEFKPYNPPLRGGAPQLTLPQLPGPQWLDMGGGRIRQKQ